MIPRFPWIRFSAFVTVIRHRVPVAPNGCPIETAPPWILNRSSGILRAICTATDAAANASLCSNISMSKISKLFRVNNISTAEIGADITRFGSTPDVT